tara:strand:+ start:6196 stop:7107 length:912 start_codon:yes stop_codon:yes gene_type:complete
MRYFIDFRSSGKRPIEKEEELEEKEEEIETIFEKRMKYLEKRKSPSPSKRLSRLAKSPSSRSRAENRNKICYQYAAIHLFENFIDIMGYNHEEFMEKLNLDLVDEKYMESFQKPIYLKLYHDPDEVLYEGISSVPFNDNDDEYLVVKSNLKEIHENAITIYYYHPNDSTKEIKYMTIKREDDNEHIFEELLRVGSAYDYIDSILDVLSEANLIHYNIVLSREEDKQNTTNKLGTLLSVVTRVNKRRHVLSIVSVNEHEHNLVDNNEKYTFSTIEDLRTHINKDYDIVNVQDVYIVEIDMDDID